jgi:hypothetical protein
MPKRLEQWSKEIKVLSTQHLSGCRGSTTKIFAATAENRTLLLGIESQSSRDIPIEDPDKIKTATIV